MASRNFQNAEKNGRRTCPAVRSHKIPPSISPARYPGRGSAWQRRKVWYSQITVRPMRNSTSRQVRLLMGRRNEYHAPAAAPSRQLTAKR